jgi:NADPH:quinone reductase-like Zn-dependent oxidoreductase
VRAYHLDRFGDPLCLVTRAHDVPEPGPGEALVRVRAASLNRRDLMIQRGTYPVPAAPGVIPLSDGAGEVAAVGPGVSRFRVGERVSSTYLLGHVDGPLTVATAARQLGASVDGMLAEYRVLHEDWLVAPPAHLSFEEAATLPCAALTAWSALTGPEPVRAGETVLTLGTGGVALFAVQLAAALGARVIAVTSSEDRRDLLRGLGATEVLSAAARPDWDAAVRELTDGRGVDQVVESVGPATLERSIRSVAFGGRIALIGAFSDGATRFDPGVFSGRLFTLRRLVVGSRTGLERLGRFLAEHGLRPVVDRVFGFDDAPAAFAHVDAGRPAGKVVVAC